MVETTPPLPLRTAGARPQVDAAPDPAPASWHTEASAPGHAGLMRLASLNADTAFIFVSFPRTLVGFVVVTGLALSVPLILPESASR